MGLMKNIILIVLLSLTQNSVAQLNETIWNFSPDFNKTISVGDVLNVTDGTWARGIQFCSKGKFKRTKFVRWYKNENHRSKPDRLKGKWQYEIINNNKFLYMTFSNRRKVKFEILSIDSYMMKLKVIELISI